MAAFRMMVGMAAQTDAFDDVDDVVLWEAIQLMHGGGGGGPHQASSAVSAGVMSP